MANTIEIIGSWPSGETEYVTGMENPERLPVVSASDNGDILTVVDGKWKDAAPSGSGLPEVTSADNGDVLTVVSGEWAKAAPSGGGGEILYVTLLWDDNVGTEGGWVLDKTYAEIRAAIASNTPVYIWGEEYGNAVLESLPSFVPTPTIRFSFFYVTSVGGKYRLYVKWLELDQSDALTLSEYYVQLTTG